MNTEIPRWVPQPGEKVTLFGIGIRGDFASVQQVLRADADKAFLTGGWLFERSGDRWITASSRDILMKRSPQLNIAEES